MADKLTRRFLRIFSPYFFSVVLVFIGAPFTQAVADSSSPKLAAYYDLYLAICDGTVYEWYDDDTPQPGLTGIKQVGVGKKNRYALSEQGELLAWSDNPRNATMVIDNVRSFSAGRTGVFAIRNDDSLWKLNVNGVLGFGENVSDKPVPVAESVLTAAIGDSANYYVTKDGDLMVRGRAHRGQYGDGKLTSTDDFVRTATNVTQVVSHTGHALIMKNDASAWGTGGNIYGPLGEHGYGDKAIAWSQILQGVNRIATGSSHSLAIKTDRSLWTWGRNEGLTPRQIMSNADAVAAGNSGSIALSNNALWQWDTGESPRRIMDCN